MTEPLQVGQFAIVDHEPVDRGPNAGIFQGKGPVDERAELFVLAEGTTPAGEAFAGHVVSAIGTAWANFDMSLSGCLSAAFREAERNIWDWNRKSIAQHRVSIGLSGFAHRGSQAIVAQAGPSVAFHLHRGELRSYFPRGEKAKAIGSGAPPEPHFTRIEFDPGDRLLLLSTVGLEEVDDELIAGILTLPGQQALQDLYQRVRGLRHVTALLVAAPEGEARLDDRPGADGQHEDEVDYVIDATSAADEHEDAGFQPSLFIEDEHEADVESARRALISISSRSRQRPEAPLSEAMVVPPLQRAAGERSDIRQLAAEYRARAGQYGPAPRPQASVAGQAANAAEPPRPIWRGGERPRVASSRRSSFTRGLVGENTPPPSLNTAASAPPVGELAAERKRSTQSGTVSHTVSVESNMARGGLVRPRRSMGGRWKGNGSLSRRTAISGGWFNDRIIVVGGLVALLVLVAIMALPQLIGDGGRASPQELVLQAEERFRAGQQASDPAEQRAAFAEAEALLLEAQERAGRTLDTQSLFNQVAGALTTLDAVVRPAAVEPIANLSQFGATPVTPTDMEAGAGYVFLLDAAASQVIAQPVDGSTASVAYGVDEALGYGRPMAIAMMDTGLLVLDEQGQFWTVFPGYSTAPVAVAAQEGMGVADIALYEGNLYILDSSQSAVHRFTFADGGFTAPEVVVSAPELKDAARLMVDGDIVTATASGEVHLYSGGLSLALSQSGIDRKVAVNHQPRSFDGGVTIAVPDPQGDRIAVFRRDGTFARQYRHDGFNGLAAMAMDGDTGYVFSGGQVRRVVFEGE